MNNKPTRSRRCIDHILTTRPDKLFKLEQIDITDSDHSILIYHRFMNIIPAEETFILTRDYKIIDFTHVNQRILNEQNYVRALTEEDPNRLAEYIIFTVNKHLDEQSQLRKVKIRDEIKEKYSQETIDLIKKKNMLYKKVKSDNLPEDKTELKNLMKTIKTKKRHDVYVRNKRDFEECNKDPKKEWQTAKNHLFSSSESSNIERIIENDSLVNG